MSAFCELAELKLKIFCTCSGNAGLPKLSGKNWKAGCIENWTDPLVSSN